MNRHPIRNRFWRATGGAVCLLAILATLGGHWMVLQSFAWARMIRQASQQDSLGTAIARTFDGEHPCNLCLAIQEGRSAEKKSDQEKPVWKIEGLPVANFLSLRGTAEYPTVIPVRRAVHKWSEPPPTPPPRFA